METLLPCLFAVSESVDDSHDPKCWKLTKVSQSRSRPEVEHQSLKNENEDFPEKVNEKVVSEDIFVDRSLFDDEREDDKESCWGSKLDDNSNLLASIEIPEFEADELEKAKRPRAQGKNIQHNRRDCRMCSG